MGDTDSGAHAAHDEYVNATDTPRDSTGEALTDTGNGINIYRRGGDGTWRVCRDMWTTARPVG